MSPMLDFIIVGAGPAGLACAIECEKKSLSYLVLDKGCVVNSIFHFPEGMTFFSTPDLLRIGDLAFVTEQFRPTRTQVLHYYVSLAKHYRLKLALYRRVTAIEKRDGVFAVAARHVNGREERYTSRKVALATGYYDNPNPLGIPGEELPKVSHYYGSPHPYYGQKVAVIGGKNSAAEAALALYRAGARVTLIHRGPALNDAVKYWIRPDIEKRLEDGKIRALFNASIAQIGPDAITVRMEGTEEILENDFVFALTGYRPDVGFMHSCGITFDPVTFVPAYDPKTMETNVAGLHLAGSVSAGINCNTVFIENSRHHGRLIVG
ncbi:MAG: YpdA family putative bacillithiol disulfide reductase [Nitrospinae bacterium]|nr:YpdA family putative bacillithiol disulfide reductase [Nitrospinota bacterium]